MDDLGGLSALSSFAQAHVIHRDIDHAQFTLTRPYYHYSLFNPGSFGEQPGFDKFMPLVHLSNVDFRRWDQEFIIDNDELSNQVSHLLSMHREFLVAFVLAEKFYEGKREREADEIFEWMYKRRWALSSWSMSLYCDLAESISLTTSSLAVRRQL